MSPLPIILNLVITRGFLVNYLINNKKVHMPLVPKEVFEKSSIIRAAISRAKDGDLFALSDVRIIWGKLLNELSINYDLTDYIDEETRIQFETIPNKTWTSLLDIAWVIINGEKVEFYMHAGQPIDTVEIGLLERFLNYIENDYFELIETV